MLVAVASLRRNALVISARRGWVILFDEIVKWITVLMLGLLKANWGIVETTNTFGGQAMRKLMLFVVLLCSFSMMSIAQEFPRTEIFAGYSFFRCDIPGEDVSCKMNGWNASAAFNANKVFGIVADFGGYYGTLDTSYAYGKPDGSLYSWADLSTHSIMFGPKFTLRRERITPFVQALFGVAHSRAKELGQVTTDNDFAIAVGGGVDINVNDWLAVRPIQLEYVPIKSSDEWSKNLRYSAGLVFKLGLVNHPPTVSCAAAKTSILQGDTTTIRASAVDPDGDKLNYSWNASGGKLEGSGDTVTFNATGVAPGKYTITNTVTDKRKHQVSCSAEITVLKRNIAPVASVEPSSFAVTQGESANLRCIASDANNDPLTYAWSVDGQSLAATGTQITFGSEGRKPGTYNVQCSVSDGEASASASSTGTVRERIIPNRPPAIECQTTTMDVASGGSIELRAKASDPDSDKLNYSWSSTGGVVSGSGETATFNATGVKAGSYTATVTVDDGRGLKASCSMTINVSERLSVTKDKCGYFAPGKDRVDNCAKAILDDLAVRMKNDPKLHANVIGYSDDSKLEARKKGLGEKRAKAVAAYLEKQGVEISRMTITDGGANNPVGDNKAAAGRTLNRRVEIELSVR